MIQILIVEDDPAIARLMQIHLQKVGYHIEICGNGLDAQGLLEKQHYQVVILDRMIPGKRGLDVLRWIRGQEGQLATIPVLMVTALSMIEERVRGLNEGADDYLTKPFEPEELVARVAALLRRGTSPQTATCTTNSIELDEASVQVHIAGEHVPLPLLEFKLLQTLTQKPGRVFSREQLLNQVWGINSFIEERTVDATIKRLRKTLATHGQGDCIQTVRGMGYRFQVRT